MSELSEVIWRQQFPRKTQIRRIESGSDLSQTEDGCPGWALRGSSWSHPSPRAFWNFFSPSLPDPSLAPCLSPLHSPSSAQTLHGSPELVSGLPDTHPAGNLQAGEGGTFLNTLGRVFPSLSRPPGVPPASPWLHGMFFKCFTARARAAPPITLPVPRSPPGQTQVWEP